jgi:hypothetical protein
MEGGQWQSIKMSKSGGGRERRLESRIAVSAKAALGVGVHLGLLSGVSIKFTRKIPT